MGSVSDFVSSIMESGKNAGSIFGSVKDAGTGAAKGFWQEWSFIKGK